MNKDIFKQFNLPNYVKGKTFAEASKIINKRFEGRNDRDSLETKKELMTRLRDAQEYVKAMHNPQQAQPHNMPDGSQMGMAPQQQPIQQPQAQAGPTQDYFLGGLLGMFGGQGGGAPQVEGAGGIGAMGAKSGGGAGLSGALGLATTALDAGQKMFGKTGIDTSGATDVGHTKMSEAGQAATGALSGAQAGMALGPIGAIGGALIGGVGGLFGAKKANKDLTEARKNNTWANIKQMDNSYALGGYTTGGDGEKNGNKKNEDKRNQSNMDKYGRGFNQEEVDRIKREHGITVELGGNHNLFDIDGPSVPRGYENVPKLNMGRFKGMDYFDVSYSGNEFNLSPTKSNPANASVYKSNLRELQKLNPDLNINNRGHDNGYVDYSNRMAKGGYTNQYDGITNPFSWLDIANTAKDTFKSALNNIPNQGIGTPESMGEIDYFGTELNSNIEELLKRPIQNKIQGQTVGHTGYKVNTDPKANLRGRENPIEGLTAGFSEGFGDNNPIKSPDISQELQQRVDMSNRDYQLPKANLENLPELLRYAPAAMNAYQLSQLEKPKEERLDRLGNKYQRQLTDEEAIQNLVREGTSNVRDSIVSSSGGSGSAARANLLASQLQGTKALSDAYMKGSEANRAENRHAQQFNLGVDQFNVGQSNQEKVINAQNQGNYDTQKSKLLAALGDNLGGIGREELFKRFPELMGSLYNWKGKYNGGKNS